MKKSKFVYSNPNLTVDWRHYRFMKKQVIVLLIATIPFCLACGYLTPRLFGGDNTPAYGIFIVFMLYWTFAFQGYLTHACPKCGKIYNGCQIYRSTCPQCGVTINPNPEKTAVDPEKPSAGKA